MDGSPAKSRRSNSSAYNRTFFAENVGIEPGALQKNNFLEKSSASTMTFSRKHPHTTDFLIKKQALSPASPLPFRTFWQARKGQAPCVISLAVPLSGGPTDPTFS